MPSAFTWLDHSDKERRRVLDAIDRFKETDTRDELGLAPIRDGFADHFFPGTTVLMTRARYFLFVPWTYLEIERKGWRDDIDARARRAEVQLIDALGEESGNIGKLSRGTLKRLASNIYWLGLGAWGIRTFDGVQPEYHRFIEAGGAASTRDARDDDGEPITSGTRRSWHAALPKPPANFPKEASLEALTRAEALYLRERIRFSAPRSLLGVLARSGELPDVDYPWMHPRLGEFARELQDDLAHAQCFAETMQGAALLYNLMLAEADKRDTVDAFRQRTAAWAAELRMRDRELGAWKVHDFWTLAKRLANVRPRTYAFVNQWLELRPWESDARARDDKTVRALVRMREAQLKGARARLSNPRALELWGGASGTERLVYRWPTARRLLADVHAAIETKQTIASEITGAAHA